MVVNGIEWESICSSNSVLEMIVDAAVRFGGQVAVRYGNQCLTYRQLLDLSQFNAENLADCGVRERDVVLCAMPTGLELPIAWLSAMTIRATIVPIDPSWPRKRLEAIVQATAARLAIVNSDSQTNDQICAGVSTYHIQSSGESRLNEKTTDLPRPNDQLYGFFTSGSTGIPKCALNHHAGLMNRFAYMTRRFGGGQIVYQNSAPLFDSSIWQLLWPLTNGGVVVLPQMREHWDLHAVVSDISRHQVTMTDFVPTLFKVLVSALETGTIAVTLLSSLRHVLIGGEEIDPYSVHTFRRLLPDCFIINTYGHTEASIGMVFHQVCDTDGTRIPLGRPIDNTFVKIVDADLNPLPNEETGEIVVGGICVGSGYLNAPDNTSRAFVANPFSDIPGSVVYRTGDLGRQRRDGLIDFAGRIDDQVKVRGVRIELSEIGIAMRHAFPFVRDALALAARNEQGDFELALAYVAENEINARRLRNDLGRYLPLTHIPQRIVRLRSLPKLENGKVDRQQVLKAFTTTATGPICPKLSGDRSMLDNVRTAFLQVLCCGSVEPNSDFFGLGGDSLGAVKLSLLLESFLGSPVAATDIYRNPTPLGLESFLSGRAKAATSLQLTAPLEIAYTNRNSAKAFSTKLLITGATGFVGIHILERLLATTALHISILVRGDTTAYATARLLASYQRAFPACALPHERLSVLVGDLTHPNLGFGHDQWLQLCNEIDEVVHCGAEVNFLCRTNQLITTNVVGTAELIRFCNEGRAKRLHHVSTLAAKPRNAQAVPTADLGDNAQALGMNGYGHTKYLADRLVTQAVEQGLAARIYRLDDVLPSISTGFPNTHSLFHLLVKYCLQHRLAPNGCGSIGLLAADAVAQWLCTFVGSTSAFSRGAFEVDVVGCQFADFAEYLQFAARRLCYEIEPIEYSAFLAVLQEDDHIDARLLCNILPAPDSGVVPFTASENVEGRIANLKQVPEHRLLAADLRDFAPAADILRAAV